MQIFYINIEEFKKRYDKDFLIQYGDKAYKNEKRLFEHSAGRYLIKYVSKSYYDVDDEIIVDEIGKPAFKNAKLHFSVSHSKDIVIACFDEYNCGIDIEYMKDRELDKFSKYYGEKFNGKEDFYKFWTLKEASFKLGESAKGKYSAIFNEIYYLTVVSREYIADVEIKKI